MSPQVETGIYVFMLATFVGFEVIRRVPPLLHTPLMSLTNAISGIALVGSIAIAGAEHTTLSTALGTVAVAASSINVIGGFMITDRMLKMFRRREPRRGGAASATPADESPRDGAASSTLAGGPRRDGGAAP